MVPSRALWVVRWQESMKSSPWLIPMNTCRKRNFLWQIKERYYSPSNNISFSLHRKVKVLNRLKKPNQLELKSILHAEEFSRINHPHFGRIQKLGAFQRLFGLLTGITRKTFSEDMLWIKSVGVTTFGAYDIGDFSFQVFESSQGLLPNRCVVKK